MSNLLQIALFLASVAVVTFVAFCIPAILQLRKHTARLARTLEELKAEVSPLVQDGRKLLHNVNELSTRVHRQCDEVEDVIQTVRGWTGQRADRVVEEVGSVLEPPILTAARNSRTSFARGSRSFLRRS